MNKNKFVALRGFTLLELIVVIAIIGILSVVVLPSFTSALAKARDGRKVSELKALQTNLMLYSQQNLGKYPANGTSTLVTTTGCNGFRCLVADKVEDKLPTGATNGTYVYVGLGCGAATGGAACTAYQVAVQLENKNQAHDGDSDLTSLTASFPGLVTGSADGTFIDGSVETCTNRSQSLVAGQSGADCIFDLIP